MSVSFLDYLIISLILSASTMYDVVYGMPSSHAQFMAFFSSYIVLFAFIRLVNFPSIITVMIFSIMICHYDIPLGTTITYLQITSSEKLSSS